jgi:hypothetical protein
MDVVKEESEALWGHGFRFASMLDVTCVTTLDDSVLLDELQRVNYLLCLLQVRACRPSVCVRM